jgi:hypothetical protein
MYCTYLSSLEISVLLRSPRRATEAVNAGNQHDRIINRASFRVCVQTDGEESRTELPSALYRKRKKIY